MSRRPLRLPPVAVTVMFAGVMWFVSSATPTVAVPLSIRAATALVLAVVGGVIAVMAVRGFRRAHTSVNPMDLGRTEALVTDGVFRFSRNPMYVAMLFLLLAFSCWLSSPVSLVAALVFVPAINRLQIVPEERALSRQFGASYLTYCKTVRRWI